MNTPDAATVDRVLRKATARLTDGVEPVRAFLIVEVVDETGDPQLAWFSLSGTKAWHLTGMFQTVREYMGPGGGVPEHPPL